MGGARHRFWLPLLLILALGGCDQVLDILNPPGPKPPGPVDLTVTPTGGPFTPSGLSANEQALLVAQQALPAGDGTAYLATLRSLDRVLSQLGESKPPGGILAAPPRLGLQGRLAPMRALELSQPAPVTVFGDIDATVEGIRFIGTADVTPEGVVQANLEAQSADGTQLTLSQRYSRDPQNRTYQFSAAGVLVYGGKTLEYTITTDYDQDGNGTAEIRIEEPESALGYHAKLFIQDSVYVEGAEAVTRADGFWTITQFQVTLTAPGADVQQGHFTLEASNGFTGQFELQADGTGSGLIADATSATLARLGVSPQGDLMVLYVDGSPPSIVSF